MKLHLTPPIEDYREFTSSFRSRPSATQPASRNPEALELIRPGRPNVLRRLTLDGGEMVASFGAAELIRHDDGRWELRGGSPANHAAAREWSSLFQHEATFPSVPLPVTAPQPHASKGGDNRILIADDDALVRGSLAAVLEFEGFVVDEAADGIEVVSHAVHDFPDLILLDLNMPKMDGWSALARLDRVRPLVPVIVITARPNQYGEAVRLGVDAFMEKPLNIQVLVHAIKQLVTEDENRHVRRITDPTFVTQLLGSPFAEDSRPAP